MSDRKLKIEEVSMLVNSSSQTINNWYRWKKTNPEHPLAKLLPDYIQVGKRQTRYWNYSDIWSILEFKKNLPHGRTGILGDITQKWYRLNKTNIKEN